MNNEFPKRTGAKVSVLLSLYRPNPDFLKTQLISLEEQDYSNMEVLIWDDCPGEDCGEIIRRILQKKPYTYVKCERTLGYVKAFEYLTGISTGDYVAFCDQDDVWEEHKITRCVDELKKQNAILATSDRKIIDEQGKVIIPSYRAHSKEHRERWQTGEDISCNVVFTCYACGMSIVMDGNAARSMIPFSKHTGHDKWVTMCAAAMGKVIYIEETLQCYRRHGKNVSGIFAQLHSKKEYYAERVDTAYALVKEFLQKFPDHPHRDEIRTFVVARKKRNIRYILRYRKIAPLVALFECCLKYTPAWVFKNFLVVLDKVE